MARANANNFVTSYRAWMRKMRKQYRTGKFEFSICFNSNTKTQRVFDAWEIRDIFPRRTDMPGVKCGATKLVHTMVTNREYGLNMDELMFTCVKRYKMHGAIIYGNQLIAEIMFWEKYSQTKYADFICPILRWGFQQGDKINRQSGDECKETAYIIAVKAHKVCSYTTACRIAEEWNDRDGLYGTPANIRKHELEDFCDEIDMNDALNNSGNCGVIFDPQKNCWKAVVIDYGFDWDL